MMDRKFKVLSAIVSILGIFGQAFMLYAAVTTFGWTAVLAYCGIVTLFLTWMYYVLIFQRKGEW